MYILFPNIFIIQEDLCSVGETGELSKILCTEQQDIRTRSIEKRGPNEMIQSWISRFYICNQINYKETPPHPL